MNVHGTSGSGERGGGFSDRELRAAWESAAAGGAASAETADGCPAADRVWAAAHGELGPAETREVVDHVAACPACAEAWRLARHLGADEAGAAAAARAAGRTHHAHASRPWWLAAVAAMLVAMIGIGTRVWSPGPAEFRGGDGAAVRPLVADGVELPRDRFELAWEPVPGAAEYDLRVTTADLVPVETRRGLDSPRYRVPPERLARLDDGSRLYWQVEVVLEDGDREASPAWEVVLAPEGRSPL